MNRSLLRFRFPTLLLLGAGVARAAGIALPLDAGTYVVGSYKPCAEAPFAGVKDYDGKSFSGPHDAGCQTVALDRRDATYRLKTTCKSAGDGTPVTPTGFVEEVRVESRTAFVVIHGKDHVEYTLCPTFRHRTTECPISTAARPRSP